MRSIKPFLISLSLFTQAAIACQTDNPVVAAQFFYAQHNDFHYANPDSFRDVVSNEFYIALKHDYLCAQNNGSAQICAIESNPWTGAQDGEISGQLKFTPYKAKDGQTIVKINYIFFVSPTETKNQSVRLIFQKRNKNGCWLVADLLQPDGSSLLKSLQAWHRKQHLLSSVLLGKLVYCIKGIN